MCFFSLLLIENGLLKKSKEKKVLDPFIKLQNVIIIKKIKKYTLLEEFYINFATNIDLEIFY